MGLLFKVKACFEFAPEEVIQLHKAEPHSHVSELWGRTSIFDLTDMFLEKMEGGRIQIPDDQDLQLWPQEARDWVKAQIKGSANFWFRYSKDASTLRKWNKRHLFRGC